MVDKVVHYGLHLSKIKENGMPNNVKNKLVLSGCNAQVEELRKKVTTSQSSFDFNGIIESPKCLEDFTPHMGVIARVENAIGKPLSDNDLLARLEQSNRIRDCFEPIKDCDLNDVIRGIKNYEECGYIYWKDFNTSNWGTKWNCYQTSEWENNTVSFETAWSSPVELIKKLSSKYPKVTIDLTYADEDSGSNTGILKIKDGEELEAEIPESGSNRGYEIYLSLNPNCDYIKLIEGKYRYVDEDGNIEE